jgi:aerobic-type carbon monoxide dehydrogenase small subunit (CoxS/CutS family)
MKLTINRKPIEIANSALDEPLVWVLLDQLQLNGPRYGCGKGLCGCCSVLVDGQLTRSCQTTMQDLSGRSVTTLEGLSQNGTLHPVQQAFADNPLQCCYCVNGHIMTAVALLEKNPNPTVAQIDAAMTINLCRCGGYASIRQNVQTAALQLRKEKAK